MHRSILLAATLACAAPSVAVSQICLSRANTLEHPHQLGASAAATRVTHTRFAELLLATSTMFGHVSVGQTSWIEVDQESSHVIAELGRLFTGETNITEVDETTTQICPIAQIGYSWTTNGGGVGVQAKEWTAAIGASAGVDSYISQSLKLVPSISATGGIARPTAGDTLHTLRAQGMLTGRLGLIYRESISLVPSFSLPLRRTEADLIGGLALVFSFGGL